ncbi:MAG TPA: sugar phosphate isomerase/epimerase [Chitinophagaceae bacterium]|nr:sugar phosphate isomerase/epimerase [Chitinophagaceae bacterium]
MQTRKKFLKLSGASLLGGMLLSNKVAASLFEDMATKPIGLQLFTFFNIIDDDVPGTLKKIAAIGYKEIESAFSKKGGYYGMKPKGFATLLNDTGMSWKSHHVLGAPFKMPAGAKMPADANGNPIKFPPMRNLRENMQELIDEVAEGGVEYLVCANTPTDTLNELKQSIETLNKTGEACKKSGITFCYHNHDMEFKEVEGQIPYHLLLSQTNADTMRMELDLCWVTKAGVDPVELFKQHPGRFPLWHVKDIDKDMTGPQPVGTGIIDFKRIFDNASTAGMKHFFVEHDMPKDPFASITSSYNYLSNMLKA